MKVRQTTSTLIQSALSGNRLKRQDLIAQRMAFAKRALANKIEVREGFSQMYVHQLTSRKTTPPVAVWDNIDSDYLALQSTGAGSVFAFLMAVLANGFRIFQKAGDALNFKLQSQLTKHDEAIRNALSESDKAIFTTLSSTALLNGFQMQFRGKGTDISKDELIKRIAIILCGKTSTHERFLDVASRAADAIMEKYDHYAQLKADSLDCAYLLADALDFSKEAKGHIHQAFDKIASSSESISDDVKMSTIAFDDTISPIAYERPVDALLPIAVYYACEYVNAGSKAKDCVKSITTVNGNGLSWLFNKGLKLFKELSVSELAKRFSVPDSHHTAIDCVKRAAKSIKVSGTFGPGAAKDAGNFVQSFIDSTLANHFGRTSASLAELSKFVPLTRQEAPFDDVAFVDAGISVSTFTAALDYFSHDFSEDVKKAHLLIGESVTLTTFEDARKAYERLCHHSSYLSGALNQLNNMFRHDPDRQLKLDPPIPTPVNLFSIGDPILEIAADREQLQQLKRSIVSEFELLMQSALKTYSVTFKNVVERKAKTFADACVTTKKKALKRSRDVAARFYLSRLTSMAYRGSHVLRHALYRYLVDEGLCQEAIDRSELKEHIFNRMHYCFMSPYDSARKKLLRFTERGLDAFNAFAAIDHLLQCEIDEIDQINLNALKFTIVCAGVDEFDTEMVVPLTSVCSVSSHFQHLIEQEKLSGSEASKLVNAMVTSRLSGINYRLNKTSFIHRQTFKLATGNRLFIEPKDEIWTVPPSLMESARATVFESSYCVINDGQLNVIETVNAIAKAGELSEKEQAKVSWLLRQIPARFFIQAGIAGWGETLNVFQVNAGQVTAFKKASGLVPIKIGSRAGKLRSALNSLFTEGKSSPPTLTFERSFEVISEEVIEDKSRRQVVFNLPIKKPTEPETSDWTPTCLIGIDPSESGFGAGVIDVNGNIKDSGFVHCHETVNYFKAKTLHMTKTQPRQEYKKSFSNHLSKQRDIALGEITNALDNLMLTLDGILVFEMVAVNAPPAFKDIWEPVIQRYTWGDNDSQNARRVQHWGGASRWLTTMVNEDGEQIKVFPGTRIGGANTSYPCPVCERNALAIVRDELNVKQSVHVVAGDLRIGEYDLTVYEPDKDTMQQRKQAQLTPLFVPANLLIKDATTTNTNGKEVIKMLIRSIRRAPAGRTSSLSSISQYHCVFSDCKATGNADGFSGVNIARKYLKNKVQAVV